MVIASTALADLVAASIGRRSSAPVSAFEWYADTSTWSVVTDQRLVDWVTRGGPPATPLREAVGREPAAFAAALDGLIVEQRFATRSLLDRMRDWPDSGSRRPGPGPAGHPADHPAVHPRRAGGAGGAGGSPVVATVLARHRPARRAQRRAHRDARGGRGPEADPLALDPAVTFTLDGYEPVAFHTYPALMRPRRPGPRCWVRSSRSATPTSRSTPSVGDRSSASSRPNRCRPQCAGRTGRRVPGRNRRDRSAAPAAGRLPRRGRRSPGRPGERGRQRCIHRGVGAPGCGALRRTRAAALSRRGPRRRSGGRAGSWSARVLADDALSAPDRRRLLVLVWGGPPVPVRRPDSLASALVLHCVDVVLDWPPPDGQGPSWLLTRSRSRPGRSLLAQAGRLLTGWDAFTEVPDGMVLTRLG